jgi:CRISPR/Cas system-associated exonuclease Cas4 (RecB family)
MNRDPLVNTISKSQFIKGRHCLKRIWLYNYRKDLMEERSAFQESILVQGTEVGKLARDLFSNGILIHEDHTDLNGAVEHTKNELNNGAVVIFEGAFVFDNILVRADILKRNDDGTFDLIEVKSSTSLKKEHLPDCAIQLYVLQKLGIHIRHVCVMHLNREYVRRGEVDLSQLFVIQPVNDKIENELENVPKYLHEIALVLSKNEEPFWRIGSICNNPYPCEFKKYCWKEVNNKSIHSISRITDKQRQYLIDSGVNLISDVPDNFKLSIPQKIQVDCEKSQTKLIDGNSIKDHLSHLQYPLYFLDFETYGYVVPQYEGTRPYQHLPFQYSLHVQHSPEAELEHYEFLFEKKENPSRALAEHLIQNIGLDGSVIVYYASFEGGRIDEMAAEFIDLAPQLISIKNRLWDLQIPFAKKWICAPEFNGSASIKNVLPVLVPSLSYDGLEIKKGDEAQIKYIEMINLPDGNLARDLIKSALLKYCGLDTLAMVYILSELQKL